LKRADTEEKEKNEIEFDVEDMKEVFCMTENDHET
jgi:hypothetical protein